MTPTQAIKAKCIDCCAGNKSEAKACTVTTCPIHQFLTEKFQRKNSKPKRIITQEERNVIAERLKIAREKNTKTKEDS